MKDNRVIIAGSRDINETCPITIGLVEKILSTLDKNETVVVSGKARGADRLGENYAKKHGISTVSFFADWDEHGKKAGYIRNKEMSEYGTHLIALWKDGSKGTDSMIKLAKDKGLKTKVIKLNWVDMTERLPTSGTIVPIATKIKVQDKFIYINYINASLNKNNTTWDVKWDEGKVLTSDKPTHWLEFIKQ